MSKIIDFNCTYDNSIGMYAEVTQKTGLHFPEAYKHFDSMVLLAEELKKYHKAPFCELPFCHTVEGEAMGGSINYGDAKIGPRANDYICTTAEELLALPEIDYSKGRIYEVLKACKHLRENGENVLLCVSGPFTIMNVLIEPRHVFKIFKKNPEVMKDIFDKFQNEILRFIAEAQKSGVNMISYADSSGGLNILGPKFSEQVVEMFTYPLLKRLEETLSDETIILLCPKTTFALLGTDKAVWKDIQLKSPINYAEACLEVIGKAKFIGQMCIKNKEFELKNGIIKTIKLVKKIIPNSIEEVKFMLTPKERLNRVLNGEKTDRPPCICPGGMMNMVITEIMDNVGITFPQAHMNAQMMSDLASAVYEKGCFENYGVPFCMTIEAEDFGAKVDMGTNIYEPHVVEYAIDSVKEWEKASPINLQDGRANVVIEAIKLLKAKGTDVPIIGNLTGPVSTASSIMEPVIFYKDLRKNNIDAHKFMEVVTDHLILLAQKQIEAGADIIAISDPSGTGEILGPKLFEEFAVKYINKVVDAVHKQNIPIIVHICGQMKNVYPQLNKIKSDAISFDSIVSIEEARKNLGNRVLMGNVSTYAIEFGDPKKISALTQKCVKDGSNIISPACGLGMKSSLKNVKAIRDSLIKGDEFIDA